MTGVYILVTKGPEYRVSFSRDIDAIYGKYDKNTNHYAADPVIIKKTFGGSSPATNGVEIIYTSITDALDFAFALSDQHHFLEDGICTLKDFQDKTFQELTQTQE